jgi:hypothetical protein
MCGFGVHSPGYLSEGCGDSGTKAASNWFVELTDDLHGVSPLMGVSKPATLADYNVTTEHRTVCEHDPLSLD